MSKIEYNLNNRKKYTFKNYYDYTITEGIGSDQGIITYFPSDYGWSYKLICYGNDSDNNKCSTEVLSTENHELSSIKVFPNPVKDILTIKTTEDITVKIFSVTSSLLKNINTTKDIKIDLSFFKKGIYILEIANSTSKKRRKLLKL